MAKRKTSRTSKSTASRTSKPSSASAGSACEDFTFGALSVGDMFHTKAARFVKTDEHRAIVVMSGVFGIGQLRVFDPSFEVEPLYRRGVD